MSQTCWWTINLEVKAVFRSDEKNDVPIKELNSEEVLYFEEGGHQVFGRLIGFLGLSRFEPPER